MKLLQIPRQMLPTSNSLALRLVAIAAGWGVIGLAAGGFLLSSLFRSAAERGFDQRLVADLESVVAVAEVDCSGTFIMPKPLIAERFTRAFSGSYWQVSTVAAGADARSQPVMRSRSLWDKTLPVGRGTKAGDLERGSAPGPIGQQLRYVERIVSIARPDTEVQDASCVSSRPFRIAVAGDLSDIQIEIQAFESTLFWSIIALGASMTLAMALFVRLGLSPLEKISTALAAIREGRAGQLEGRYPSEIQPLADELNALVKHNADVVARARTHVGNLAHFLKTPLSVLANEAKGASSPLADAVNKQVGVMRRQIDHYLARARTVASAGVIGARCDVAPVMADLSRALSKIYDAQGIAIQSSCADGLVFRGDRADLEEMLGNLLDNACKWASETVSIEASGTGTQGRLRIVVADDGPGLSEEQKKRVLERGERLDETKPGSGLGLGIVREIAGLYGGTFRLGRSDAGGLSVELDLPALDRTA
jgi:signal transduction histidine kinase